MSGKSVQSETVLRTERLWDVEDDGVLGHWVEGGCRTKVARNVFELPSFSKGLGHTSSRVSAKLSKREARSTCGWRKCRSEDLGPQGQGRAVGEKVKDQISACVEWSPGVAESGCWAQLEHVKLFDFGKFSV